MGLQKKKLSPRRHTALKHEKRGQEKSLEGVETNGEGRVSKKKKRGEVVSTPLFTGLVQQMNLRSALSA